MMQCIDCAYYRPPLFGVDLRSVCKHPVVDPVGEGAYPVLERGPFGKCKPEGVYFTPRPVPRKGFFRQLWEAI